MDLLQSMLGEGAKPDPEWCDWSEDTYEGAKNSTTNVTAGFLTNIYK